MLTPETFEYVLPCGATDTDCDRYALSVRLVFAVALQANSFSYGVVAALVTLTLESFVQVPSNRLFELRNKFVVDS